MDARLRAHTLAVHQRRSPSRRRVVERFLEDWTTRWFPRPARPLGRQILLATMDDSLRATLRLETPSRRLQRLLRASARVYSPLVLVRPLRSDRSWLDHFGRHHLGALDFERIGHRDQGTAPRGC